MDKIPEPLSTADNDSLTYRPVTASDIPALFDVRVSTQENSFSREELTEASITDESVAQMLAESHAGWLCETPSQVVGFSIGDLATGELWVIAVRPEFEKRGIGSELLQRTEGLLWSRSTNALWLVTSLDRTTRAFHFYQSKGWEVDSETSDELRLIKHRSHQD